jgi:hypothetical protein
MNGESNREFSPESQKFESEFRQLGVIKEVLSTCGLDVCKYPDKIIQRQFEERNTFPIANDGAQGIRVTRNREGVLTVFFTNGFEDPRNEKRKEVTNILHERGIDVV